MSNKRWAETVDRVKTFILVERDRYPRIHANLALVLARVPRDVMVDLGWSQARFTVGLAGDPPVSIRKHPIRNELTFKVNAGLEKAGAMEIRLALLTALARWCRRHQFEKDVPKSVIRNQMSAWGFTREAEAFASR